MSGIDSDTMMIVAGVVFSLLALIELYPSWKNTRDDRPV
jgi:hypothetical protein